MEGEGNDHTKKPSRSAGKPTQGFRIKIAELHHLRSSKQISARGQGRESGHARTPSWSPGKPTPKVGEPSEQTDRSHLCRVLAEAWVFSRCCRRFTKRGDGFLFAAEWKEKKKRRNARKKNKNRCGSGDEGRHIKISSGMSHMSSNETCIVQRKNASREAKCSHNGQSDQIDHLMI